MEEHDVQKITPGSPENPPPDDLNTGPAPRNPPDGPSEGPKEAPFGQHKPYPAEHKQAILQAYAVWKGAVDEFCAQHKVYKGTLWAWRREFIRLEKAKGQDGTILPKIPAYTPEQRRQAVEAFVKSGQSLKDFALLWGVIQSTLARWVRAYVEGGPKALENRAGRKRGERLFAHPFWLDASLQLQAITMIPSSEFFSNSSMVAASCRSRDSISSVEQLPLWIQTTLGGNPSVVLKSL